MISFQQIGPSGGAQQANEASLPVKREQQADQQADQDHDQVLQAIKLEQRHHQEQVECASVLSSLSGHISLMNKQQQQQQQQQKSCQNQQANSTSSGYHSAASSPTSSVLSPVSTSYAASPTSSSPSSSGSPGSSSPSVGSKQQGQQPQHHQQQQQQQHRSSHPDSPTSSTSPANLLSSQAKRPEASGQNRATGYVQSPYHQQPVASVTTSNLQRQPAVNSSNPPHLLDYYPETNHDGLKLTWFHEANSRAKLAEALTANKMLISGDISLAEMSRYPLPIMARPPLGVSDIMLENWLQEVLRLEPQRGVKLTFTSTRTVEPAFRVLARHSERLKGPLILSADILSWPSQAAMATAGQRQANELAAQQYQQPVDAWTFLMLCRTRFPRCIISIGWTGSLGACGGVGGSSPQPANQPLEPVSFHSSTDSMFELDTLLEPPLGSQTHHLADLQHQQEAQNLAAIAAAVANANANASANVNKQHTYHQIGHLSSQLSQHLSSSQRLHPYSLAHHNSQHRQHRHSVFSLSQLNNQGHHHILSSSASLNSSSGNSSGSSSPTSPTGHLLSPQGGGGGVGVGNKSAAKSHQAASHYAAKPAASQIDQQLHLLADEQHQQQLQFLHSGQSAAAAIAAAVAAAASATSNNQQPYQQLPLNLNINEAHQHQHQQLPQKQSHQGLSELSQKIQSYQMISQQQQQATACFAPSSMVCARGFQHQQQHQQQPVVGSLKQAKQQAASANSRTLNIINNNNQKQQLLLKTTSQPAALAAGGGGYTREMIDKMASVVKEYNLTQPVTFPVEAKLLIRNQQHSLAELQRLLHQVGSNSTLTVVAQQDDLISLDDILNIRKAFGAGQVLFDLPEELAASLRRQLDLV